MLRRRGLGTRLAPSRCLALVTVNGARVSQGLTCCAGQGRAPAGCRKGQLPACMWVLAIVTAGPALPAAAPARPAPPRGLAHGSSPGDWGLVRFALLCGSLGRAFEPLPHTAVFLCQRGQRLPPRGRAGPARLTGLCCPPSLSTM